MPLEVGSPGSAAVPAAYERIVQHGTQSRASLGSAQMAAVAASGKYGKLLVSRGLCYKDGGTGGSANGASHGGGRVASAGRTERSSWRA